jgi:hypothetical protein
MGIDETGKNRSRTSRLSSVTNSPTKNAQLAKKNRRIRGSAFGIIKARHRHEPAELTQGVSPWHWNVARPAMVSIEHTVSQYAAVPWSL